MAHIDPQGMFKMLSNLLCCSMMTYPHFFVFYISLLFLLSVCVVQLLKQYQSLLISRLQLLSNPDDAIALWYVSMFR